MLGHDQVREEAEVLGGAGGLAPRLLDRQAGVEALHLGQLVAAGLHDVGDRVQHAGALARQGLGPFAGLEGPLGGGDGAVDVRGLAGGGRQVRLVGHRVEHLEGVAVDRVDELAVDVVAQDVGQARGLAGLDAGLLRHGVSFAECFGWV